MGPVSNAGARFRQRKISVKQTLQVIKQSDIPDFDLEDQQRELQHIETGVEKGEEEEHHLQQVINASAAKFKGANVKQVYIPTPDASRIWKEADKYYYQKFSEPSEYIKFSAVVEDTSGCQYNMDERDDEFLQQFNKNLTKENQCTEDEFEIICERFDKIIDEKQPFLTMDPQQILSFDEIKKISLDPNSIKYLRPNEILAKKLNIPKFKTLYDADSSSGRDPRPIDQLIEKFGASIYEHWKNRRIERNGKPVFPTLKFEDPSQKDDSNPYTCFRRREFRQARKTRRTDTQSIHKLKVLYTDLKRAENLLLLVGERELKKQNLFEVNYETLKLRKEFKQLKRDANIKIDDELLYDKPKKKRPPIGYIPPPPVHKNEEKSKSNNKGSLPSNNKTSKTKIKAELSSSGSNKKSTSMELSNSNAQTNNNNNINKNNENNISNKLPQAVIQPYVKLPPAKIPDIELTTVNTVLKDKLEGIKKAVSDKLIKRKLQDEGWINFTDDPYNPYFDMSLNDNNLIEEKSHIPYSSIASSMFEVENSREINFSHIFNNNRHYSNNDSEIVKINFFTGQVVKNDRHTYLPEFYDAVGDEIPNTKFGRTKSELYEEFNEKNRFNVSEALFKVRKRHGRGGRIWMDRKRTADDDLFEEYLNYSDSEDSDNDVRVDGISTSNQILGKGTFDHEEKLFDDGENIMDVDKDDDVSESSPVKPKVVENSKKRRNAYDCNMDAKKRLKSRFMFDSDLPISNPLDPSKLNQIGKQTQAVRFGCMLLSKAYDNMHQIRQKQILHHQQKLQQQQHQQREQQLREQKERERQAVLARQNLNNRSNLKDKGFENGNKMDKLSSSLTASASTPKNSKTPKEKKAKKESDSKKPKINKKGLPKEKNKNSMNDISGSPSVKLKIENSVNGNKPATISNPKVDKENKI
ncbi:Epl1 protein [Pichia kluyveri]|uniref:Enhancer of polycomb-like protein n=1 Tax=Pichia kluyveri TaxID=36015 RepID=A0AAV5R355_PICKL|nr:Epl1 protein [Pichia kluyveri]